MAEIQQQIADGARQLARVGDVIAHGEAIPANVVRLRSAGAAGRSMWERAEGGFRMTWDGSPLPTRTPAEMHDMFPSRFPMTVVEVDPEPQPAEPVALHRYEPAPGMVCAVCGRDVMDDIHPDVQREHPCPNGDPHGPHTHRGFAAPDGTPPLWCPGRVAAPTSDPGTFAECVAWLIDAGLGSNADRRIDRMASQHQELQAHYDTVVSDRETVRGALSLRKERCRKEHDAHTDESGRATIEALRDELETTQLLLAQAEQYARDLQDGTHPGLEAVLDTVRDEARREATEGWGREWGVDLGLKGNWPLHPCDSEPDARRVAAARAGRTVVSRRVGLWEVTE